MADLKTTLAVQRPSGEWTVLFEHAPYAPALWSLLFEPGEALLAADHFGAEWPRISADRVIADHAVGFRATAAQTRGRLVARLDAVRIFAEAWRAFSLARALAFALAALPDDWTVRLDASAVTMAQGARYADLMATAVAAAAALPTRPPTTSAEALRALHALVHGMNPQSSLTLPAANAEALPWPTDAVAVGRALLGTPVECPTSHVEAMTRARRQWEARW